MSKDSNMFYDATPAIFEKAKMLRASMTQHEKILWEQLRTNKKVGLRFKAQHPINTFTADFYCHRLKLVIEIDGKSHRVEDQKEYDRGRSSTMKELGITTMRFSNSEIENDLNAVLETIKTFSKNPTENPNQLHTPTLKGEVDLNSQQEQSPLKGVGGQKSEGLETP